MRVPGVGVNLKYKYDEKFRKYTRNAMERRLIWRVCLLMMVQSLLQ